VTSVRAHALRLADFGEMETADVSDLGYIEARVIAIPDVHPYFRRAFESIP
jgi:hypothetical protein